MSHSWCTDDDEDDIIISPATSLKFGEYTAVVGGIGMEDRKEANFSTKYPSSRLDSIQSWLSNHEERLKKDRNKMVLCSEVENSTRIKKRNEK